MNSQPLVSVIIPFYNTPPQFMKEAITSVLTQSFSHWEILLVDDGSIGESAQVGREYAARYPQKVRYLEHENHQNRGLSASRNLAIRHARGEYVAFLDADDVWLSHKLEQQVAILNALPGAVMLYGNSLYWYSWTGHPQDVGRDFMPRLGVQPDTLVTPPRLLPLYLQGQAAVPCPCSVLVRYQTIEEIGGFEEAFTTLYEDQVFYAKICLAAPVFVAGACWDRYRQHSASMCATAKQAGQSSSTRLTFLNWLAAYLSERGIQDAAVWQALRQELRRIEEPMCLNWHDLSRYVGRRGRKLWSRLTAWGGQV
jgi:glycosyltransferase involved in cell wall biosynthesis